jgi:hypothetical protein
MKQLACLVLLALAISACLPTPEAVTVLVYFQNVDSFAVGKEPYENSVERLIPAADDRPRAVLEQLFIGPTPEEQAQGLALVLSGSTGFSDFWVEDGVAHVTLTGECNSKGSTYTIANLIFANLAQFPEIQWVKIYDEKGETETPVGQTSSIPFCLEP